MVERNPSHCSGVPRLDAHHEETLRWVAELESAAADQRTLFGAYAITRLKSHARVHFAAEEDLMQAADCPNLTEHMAEHAEFSAKIDELQLKFIEQELSIATVKLLRDWLTQHVARSDLTHDSLLGNLTKDVCLV